MLRMMIRLSQYARPMVKILNKENMVFDPPLPPPVLPASLDYPPFQILEAVVAQAAGAVGLVIVNTEPGGGTFAMSAASDHEEGSASTNRVNIPVAMVRARESEMWQLFCAPAILRRTLAVDSAFVPFYFMLRVVYMKVTGPCSLPRSVLFIRKKGGIHTKRHVFGEISQ